jgi:hypothetical protein
MEGPNHGAVVMKRVAAREIGSDGVVFSISCDGNENDRCPLMWE